MNELIIENGKSYLDEKNRIWDICGQFRQPISMTGWTERFYFIGQQRLFKSAITYFTRNGVTGIDSLKTCKLVQEYIESNERFEIRGHDIYEHGEILCSVPDTNSWKLKQAVIFAALNLYNKMPAKSDEDYRYEYYAPIFNIYQGREFITQINIIRTKEETEKHVIEIVSLLNRYNKPEKCKVGNASKKLINTLQDSLRKEYLTDSSNQEKRYFYSDYDIVDSTTEENFIQLKEEGYPRTPETREKLQTVVDALNFYDEINNKENFDKNMQGIPHQRFHLKGSTIWDGWRNMTFAKFRLTPLSTINYIIDALNKKR